MMLARFIVLEACTECVHAMTGAAIVADIKEKPA